MPLEIQGTDFLRPINYVENKGSAQCKSAVIFGAMITEGTTIIKAKKAEIIQKK